MQLLITPSENGINYEELKNRKFESLDVFKVFCNEMGISFDDNFTVVDNKIYYSMNCLVIVIK